MRTIDRRDITTDIILQLTPKDKKEVEDIILEHLILCRKNGAVHLGTNLQFSEETIRKIDSKGHDIRIVFVGNKNENYKPKYIADLIDIKIYKGNGNKGYLNDVIPCPQYYQSEEKKCWFKLVNMKKVDNEEINLNDYRLLRYSNEKKVSETIKNRPCFLYAYKEN